MNIRTFFTTALSVFLFASASFATAAQPVSPVKLAVNIYTFTGTMANSTALVTDEGVLLVDSGETAELGEALRAAIATVTDKPVRYLINTHYHYDHANGNAAFGATGTTIVGQDNMRRSLTTRISWPNTALPPREAWPVITFADSMTLYFGGEEIYILHPANGGQTCGDCVVYFRKANVLAAGDFFRNGTYSYIDAEDGGWAEGMAAGCREALKLTDEHTIVVPGHGKPTDRAGLEQRARMLEDVNARVKALMAEGKLLKEIQDARPTAAWDAIYGCDAAWADKFVEFVYNGIVKHKAAQDAK